MVVPRMVRGILDKVYDTPPEVDECERQKILPHKTIYDVQFKHGAEKDDISIVVSNTDANGDDEIKKNRFRAEPLLSFQRFKETDVPVPKVLRTGVHNGTDFYITDYVDAVPAEDVFHKMRPSDKQTLMYYVGCVLGHVHNVDSFEETGKITAEAPGELVVEENDSESNSWHSYLYSESIEWAENLQQEYDEYTLQIKNILIELATADKHLNEEIEFSICHTQCRPACIGVHTKHGLKSIFDFQHAISGDKFYDVALTELLFIDLQITDQIERSVLRRSLYEGYCVSNDITPRYREYRSLYRLVGLVYYLSEITPDEKPVPPTVGNVSEFYHEQIRQELDSINS